MDPMTILYIIVLIIALAIKPKATKVTPASLEEFEFATAEPGNPIPIVLGTILLTSPNVVWYGDLGTSAIKTKSGK